VDLVNQGISTARRMRAAYTIRLSINKDLKLKEKERERQVATREDIYTSLVTLKSRDLCVYHNVYILPFPTSAVIGNRRRKKERRIYYQKAPYYKFVNTYFRRRRVILLRRKSLNR